MQRGNEFEIERQIELIESGGRVRQESRLWADRASHSRIMRSKEEAHDYRYFPEPDLPPLVIARDFIEGVRATLPELPEARRRRFMDQYALSFSDASQLTSERQLADYYERAAEAARNARAAANWIRTELLRELETSGTPVEKCPIPPEEIGALIRLIKEGKIS